MKSPTEKELKESINDLIEYKNRLEKEKKKLENLI